MCCVLLIGLETYPIRAALQVRLAGERVAAGITAAAAALSGRHAHPVIVHLEFSERGAASPRGVAHADFDALDHLHVYGVVQVR